MPNKIRRIYADDELWNKLRSKAALQGTNASDITRQLWQEAVSGNQARAVDALVVAANAELAMLNVTNHENVNMPVRQALIGAIAAVHAARKGD